MRDKLTKITASMLLLLLTACVGMSGCGEEEATPSELDFPSRTINIITGWLGGSAQFLEAIAPEAEEELGVPVAVIDKVGNNGLDAVLEFESLPADGYTLLTVLDLEAASFAQGIMDFNPAEDLIPILIGNVAITQIYIRTDEQRYSNWDELVAYAQEHPGLKVATIGTPLDMENLCLSQLESAFGVQFQQVPYEKSQDRYASLVAGQTDLLIEQPGDVKEFLDAGTFRPVLTLWDERVEGFEDVPVVAEWGVDFTPLLRVRALAVATGTPQDRVDVLKAGFEAAFNSEAFQQCLEERMLDLVPYPEDPDATMKGLVETYQRLYEKLLPGI
jgi:tripartite-type tricarboxylate transporter receptor subunit TctC